MTILALNNSSSGAGATGITITGNMLSLVDAAGNPIGNPLDLTIYLDDTNLARLTSGTLDVTGIATFTRDDGTTFTLDLSSLMNLSAADIQSLYESNADTERFTTTDMTKLDNIENNATADQTGAEIAILLAAEPTFNSLTAADRTLLDSEIEAGATADQDADEVPYTPPTTSTLTATDVDGAINELEQLLTAVDSENSTLASVAITGESIVAAPVDDVLNTKGIGVEGDITISSTATDVTISAPRRLLGSFVDDAAANASLSTPLVAADAGQFQYYNEIDEVQKVWNGVGWVELGGGSLEVEVAQAAHGFVVGQPIAIVVGGFAAATADAASGGNLLADAIVTEVTTNTFLYQVSGFSEKLNGLVEGESYFTPTTAGVPVATAPSAVGEYSQPLLTSQGADGAIINIKRAVVNNGIDALDFVDTSAGIVDAGKGVTLNAQGQLNSSLLGEAITQPLTDNSTNIATTEFVNDISELNSIGVNQTWQNVLASRAGGITYTNTTGKPILVSIAVSTLSGAGVFGIFRVDGIDIGLAGNRTLSAQGIYGTISSVIPDGSTYILILGGTTSLNRWAELR